MVLFFIELSTRKVEIAGIAAVANRLWMSQIGRDLTDAVDGILNLVQRRQRLGTVPRVSIFGSQLGQKYGVEFAEAFHYIGPPASGTEDTIRQRVVPLK